MRQEGTPDAFLELLLDAWSSHRSPLVPRQPPYPRPHPSQFSGDFSYCPVLQTGLSVAAGSEAVGPRTQHSTPMAVRCLC